MSKALAGGWSRTAKLVSGNKSKIGSLQQTFPKAEAYTVTFTLKVDGDVNETQGGGLDPLLTVATITTEAIVEFTVAGNTYTRKLSVMDGASITGVCNQVRIRLIDTTAPEGGATIVGLPYHVTMNVAPGTRADAKVPPYLQLENVVFSVPGAGSTTVQIPTNAGVKCAAIMVVALNGSVIPDGGARVVQTTMAATAIAMYDPRSFDWAPIAPGATALTFENLTATQQEWAIFWGIDG